MSHVVLAAPRLPVEGRLPTLSMATTWLNSEPLTAADLRGKVVLVQFWTYTCINWLRTLPYVQGWAEKYRDKGLIVIGVHTPEFGFEKDVGNIRQAARALGVDYPIAVDSDYLLWNAFANHYWPALYFIDAQGRIRHHQFGEGNYEQSEAIVQQLLFEAGRATLDAGRISPEGRGAAAAADWKNLKSPETYVGYGRAGSFVSPGGGRPDKSRTYSVPEVLKLNEWALSGDWTMHQESASVNKPDGRIAYRFHARDVHLVARPTTRGSPVRFRVSIDGRAPGPAHGGDTDESGFGTVDQARMYQLIRQQAPIVDRLFEIEFLDAGAEVFVFTFG